MFDGHTLNASLHIAHEDIDGQAYQQAALVGTLETVLRDIFTLRYGGSIEFVRDEGLTDGGDYALIGLRGEISYDGANDLLDPTEGSSTQRCVSAPMSDGTATCGTSRFWRRWAAAYLLLDEKKTFVLAGRVRLGTIVGDGRDDIPLPKRFFAGGGGSIRGYSYERAGPIDIDDRPVGGASVIEINAEARWRIDEDFGAVLFVDGGGAFESLMPGQDGDWFVGTRLGVRYYSPIGPVRLDIAAPLNARRAIPACKYVSIGQAF